MTGDALTTAALGIKQTTAFKWYKAIRIDLHAEKWPAAFENSINWTDTPVVTVAVSKDKPVQDIVLIFARERITVREPHAIQMTLDEATELLGELDAYVNPHAAYNPSIISLIMRSDDGPMAGIKLELEAARAFTILLWSVVDSLATQSDNAIVTH